MTPTEVHVDQQPGSGRVLGFYKTRKGAYVIDREELEEEGYFRAEYGPTRTSFYLNREDIDVQVERPPGVDDEEDSAEPELRPVPVDALQVEVADHFRRIVSNLQPRYEERISERLLLDIALRQTLVDFQVHGKDSPLVQQIDALSIMAGQSTPGAEPDLRPMPVDRLQADVVEYLEKALATLRTRYEKEFSERRFFEVALRQMFVDLRTHRHEATVVQWLDVLLRS
ncbi:MAG: hypothetical protein ABEL51_07770 [Salinibacter sp.]